MSYARTAVTRMTLDVSRPDLQRSETVTLGDTNRRWEVTLINGGAPFRLPPNWTAALTGIKPDGTGLLNGCSVADGKIIYDFAAGAEIATCAGNYPVQFDIWDEVGDLVASPKIYVNVLDDARPHAELDSNGQYTLIGEVLSRVYNAENDIVNNAKNIENNRENIEQTGKDVSENKKNIALLATYVPSADMLTIPKEAWKENEEKKYSTTLGESQENTYITLWAADEVTKKWLDENDTEVKIVDEEIIVSAKSIPGINLNIVKVVELYHNDTDETYRHVELVGIMDESERLNLGNRMKEAEKKLESAKVIGGQVSVKSTDWEGSEATIKLPIEINTLTLLWPDNVASSTIVDTQRIYISHSFMNHETGEVLLIRGVEEDYNGELQLRYVRLPMINEKTQTAAVQIIGTRYSGSGGGGGSTIIEKNTGEIITIDVDSWSETKSIGLTTWITGAIPLDDITPQTMIRLSALDGETAADWSAGQTGAEITYDEETETYSLRVGVIGDKPTADWQILMETATVEETEGFTGPWVSVIPPVTDATDKVADHNYDEAAHPDIRDLIKGLDAEAVGADSAGTAESKTSALRQEVNTQLAAYDKSTAVTNKISAHNVSTESHQDIRVELQRLADRLNAALNSDDTSLDDLKEIVAYIKSNKTLIDGVTASKVNVTDIEDNLVTNVSNKPLSAAQGVVLKLLIDSLEEIVEGKTTPDQVAAQIKTALTPYILKENADKTYQPIGDYLTPTTGDQRYAKPSDIPTVPQTLPNPYALTILGKTYNGSSAVALTVEEIIEAIKTASGGVAAYLDGNKLVLSGNLPDATYTAYYEVDGELVKIGDLTLGAVTPDPVTYTVTFVADGVTVAEVEYAVGDTIEEPAVPAKDGYTGVWETYDLTKGGNITVNAEYTAIEVEPAGPTNLLTAAIDTDGSIYNGVGYLTGYRLGAGANGAMSGYTVTGYMPAGDGTSFVIRTSNKYGISSSAYSRVALYDANFTFITGAEIKLETSTLTSAGYTYETGDQGGFAMIDLTSWRKNYSNATYWRMSTASTCIDSSTVITLNEEIE